MNELCATRVGNGAIRGFIFLLVLLQCYELLAQSEPIVIDVDSFIYSSALSPDGRLVATGVGWRDTAMVSWDALTGQEVLRFERPSSASGVEVAAFSPDGEYVLGGERMGSAILWETATGTIAKRMLVPPPPRPNTIADPVDAVAFTPDGGQYATLKYGRLTFWDLQTHEQVRTFHAFIDMPAGQQMDMAILPEIRRLFVTNFLDTGSFVNLDTGSLIESLPGSISISPDGRRLAQIRLNETVCNIIDVNSLEVVSTVELGVPGWLPVFSPDSTRLFYTFDGMARLDAISETGEREELRTFTMEPIPDGMGGTTVETVRRTHYSPDGQRVLLQTGKRIYIYDISDIPTAVYDGGMYGR